MSDALPCGCSEAGPCGKHGPQPSQAGREPQRLKHTSCVNHWAFICRECRDAILANAKPPAEPLEAEGLRDHCDFCSMPERFTTTDAYGRHQSKMTSHYFMCPFANAALARATVSEAEGLEAQQFTAHIKVDLGESGQWDAGQIQRLIEHEMGDCASVVVVREAALARTRQVPLEEIQGESPDVPKEAGAVRQAALSQAGEQPTLDELAKRIHERYRMLLGHSQRDETQYPALIDAVKMELRASRGEQPTLDDSWARNKANEICMWWSDLHESSPKLNVLHERITSELTKAASRGAEPPTLEVESLAEKFHDIYQQEAKRQGDVRHKDAYADLPENVKEFDRALARYVLGTITCSWVGGAEGELVQHQAQLIKQYEDQVHDLKTRLAGAEGERLRVLEEAAQKIELLMEHSPKHDRELLAGAIRALAATRPEPEEKASASVFTQHYTCGCEYESRDSGKTFTRKSCSVHEWE